MHIDEEIDGLARTAQRQGAIGLPRYRDHALVDTGRRAAVDADFRLTRQSAVFRRRKIKVGKNHGALQLQHPVAAQEHHRHMGLDGFDDFDLINARLRKSGWVTQKRDDFVLCARG